jgi:hypothetical protein
MPAERQPNSHHSHQAWHSKYIVITHGTDTLIETAKYLGSKHADGGVGGPNDGGNGGTNGPRKIGQAVHMSYSLGQPILGQS